MQNHTATATKVLPRTYGLAAILGLILISVQFLPTLSTYFIADDYAWLDFARKVTLDQSQLLTEGPGGFLTPISTIYFVGLFRLFGLDPRGYFIANLALHIANAVLVFGFVKRLTNQLHLAAVAASIFTIHFVQWADWGIAVWIAAYLHLVAVFFALLCLNLYLRFLASGRLVTLLAAVISCMLALFSKESAASLPLLLVLVTCYFAKWNLRAFMKRGWPLFPFLLSAAVYFAFRVLPSGLAGNLPEGKYSVGWHMFSNLTYFSNLITPNLDSGPVFSFLQKNFSEAAIQGIRIVTIGFQLTCFALASFFVIRRSRTLAFWVAFAVACYLPFLGFTGGWAGPSRYFYLPSIGFSVVLSSVLLAVATTLSDRIKSSQFRYLVVIGLVIALSAYNLIPVLLWNKLMRESGQVRRETLALIGSEASKLEAAASCNLVFKGYPSRFGDLTLASEAFFQKQSTFLRDNEAIPTIAGRSCVVDYNQGSPMWVLQ